MALLPWPAVAAGLFLFHSAFLAFLFYACVCLYGTWRLGGFACRLRPQWPLKTHLGIALVSNLVLVGLYQLLGKWVLPADFLIERLATVGVTKASFLWLFPYFLIGNPLVEELFWRGGLRLRSFVPGQPLPSLSVAFFFGAWHSLPIFLIAPLWVAPLAVLGVMTIGFALGEVADITETLGDAILLHALAADLPLLIILFLASR
ncbi:CPBP family intramembrane glutamic endopeptidase [Armatimonas sp.]|uniref:CPBP family intramembrane glutamic endopeptidase n=1 Tax=Armatimonas sp. TaxID=1872638 RepID=UPI0037530B46